MNGRRPPRRPRWPKASDNMAIALRLAAKPAAADVAEIMATLRTATRALREGVATQLQWAIVAGGLDLAKAIERQGIVRGLVEHLNSTHDSLQAIYSRAMRTGCWKPTALYWDELDNINAFVNLHDHQITALSRAEFIKALDAATNDIKRSGHRATVARDISGVAA